MGEKKPKKPISPTKGAIAGGVFGALGAVTIGQKVSYEILKSQNLTLVVVGGGFLLGALIGFTLVRAKTKPS